MAVAPLLGFIPTSRGEHKAAATLADALAMACSSVRRSVQGRDATAWLATAKALRADAAVGAMMRRALATGARTAHQLAQVLDLTPRRVQMLLRQLAHARIVVRVGKLATNKRSSVLWGLVSTTQT